MIAAEVGVAEVEEEEVGAEVEGAAAMAAVVGVGEGASGSQPAPTPWPSGRRSTAYRFLIMLYNNDPNPHATLLYPVAQRLECGRLVVY